MIDKREAFELAFHSGDLDTAEDMLLDLEDPYAYSSLAYIDLRRGDLRGFHQLYYLRQRFPELWTRVGSSLPPWTGQDLTGQMLHLTLSEGTGDTIQLLRYAQVLKERYPGLTVTLMCPLDFVRLAESCEGIDVAWTEQDEHPEDGYFVDLLALPHFCRTETLADIPGGVPYFHPEKRLVDGWRWRLAASLEKPTYRVAICWRGNPLHANDKRRSIPSHFFERLTLPGVQLFSVQKDAITDVPEGILDPPLGDYADTAALLSLMDLTITVDTSVAHLAGALGLPV